MGKKTIRNWIRVDCENCNGSGVTEIVRALPNGEIARKYSECEECMGGGKVNKAIRESIVQSWMRGSCGGG